MQTHLSEQKEEIDLVSKLFPNFSDYLSVYEKFGLVRENSIFGHSIHLQKREIQRLM